MFDAEVGDEYYNKPQYTRSNSKEHIEKDGIESEATLDKTNDTIKEKVDTPHSNVNDDPNFLVNNELSVEEEKFLSPL